MFRARAGSLDTRFLDTKLDRSLDDTCGICGDGNETLEHILMDCLGLADLREGLVGVDLGREENMKWMLGLEITDGNRADWKITEQTKLLLAGWWDRRGGD